MLRQHAATEGIELAECHGLYACGLSSGVETTNPAKE
jgi:hypothetical protein